MAKLISQEVGKEVAKQLKEVNTKMHKEYVQDNFELINSLGNEVQKFINAGKTSSSTTE